MPAKGGKKFSRHAAEFHSKIEDLVDLEQVIKERIEKRERQFRVKKLFGFRHRMIWATVDKNRR